MSISSFGAETKLIEAVKTQAGPGGGGDLGDLTFKDGILATEDKSTLIVGNAITCPSVSGSGREGKFMAMFNGVAAISNTNSPNTCIPLGLVIKDNGTSVVLARSGVKSVIVNAGNLEIGNKLYLSQGGVATNVVPEQGGVVFLGNYAGNGSIFLDIRPTCFVEFAGGKDGVSPPNSPYMPGFNKMDFELKSPIISITSMEIQYKVTGGFWSPNPYPLIAGDHYLNDAPVYYGVEASASDETHAHLKFGLGGTKPTSSYNNDVNSWSVYQTDAIRIRFMRPLI